ncbi:MAG: LLM class flavin-dependent oxidoreductase [Nitrososphaerales archaeon]
MLTKLGIGFSNSTPLRDLYDYSLLAEQNDLSFWLNEGYHNRSSIVVMSSIAARTHTLELGLGIVSPLLRHPFIIAMEAGALDELSEGRLTLGLGIAASGAKRHNINVGSVHPVKTMEESARVIREMIEGKTVTSDLFPAQKEGVKLGFRPPRSRIPLYLGAMHSKMLELGGEFFDGVLLNYACPLSYARFALEHIRSGSEKRRMASGSSSPQVVAFLLLSIAEKHDLALEASRKYLPHYLSRAYPITLKYAGVSEKETAPVLEALKNDDHKIATSKVSDELIAKLTISGTAEECITEIRKYADIGIDQVIAEQIMGPVPNESIEILGKEIAPRLVSKVTKKT